MGEPQLLGHLTRRRELVPALEAPPHRDRGRPRALRLRLDGHRFRALEPAAAEVEVNVEQLAAIRLAERLSAEAESQAVIRAAADLRDTPRTGRPPVAAVSRRIANPYYRALLVRNGHRVALAGARPDHT